MLNRQKLSIMVNQALKNIDKPFWNFAKVGCFFSKAHSAVFLPFWTSDLVPY